MAAARPHFYSLFVTPQFEQVRRFSTMNIRPFIRESPLRHLWQSTTTEDSVLQRTFTNGARMLFSFAGLDADRTRGISAHRVAFDELQDMDKDHIPIILETLSADKEYALEQYSGTSKTTTTALAVAWQRSSQAEYWIPCDHCTTMGNRTYNIPSLEYHIERMLGPLHMNISEELAAIDHLVAVEAQGDEDVRRLLTIPGVDVTTAVTLVAVIGDISRFPSSRHLVGYLGLHPRVRQSGSGPAHHGRRRGLHHGRQRQ